MSIQHILARRVWDSRGRPTVEAEVELAGGARGRAIAPAGASRGTREAVDLRDGGTRFGGHDVMQACEHVRARIDGKSPVEYLVDERDRDTVRAFARPRIATAPARLHAIAAAWSTA